jgi:hypothetical protein
MAEYIYAREIDSTGKYNIDNTLYLDGLSQMIHLGTDINSAIPGVGFCMKCSGSTVTITTDIALDSAQETTMTNTITTYKAQTGA